MVVSLSDDSLALTRRGLSRSRLREDATLAGMRGAPRTQGTVCVMMRVRSVQSALRR